MDKYTKEPWRIRNDGHEYNGAIIESESLGAGYFSSLAQAIQRDPHPRHRGGVSQAEAEANARRIVACVNACAGIETELLEIVADNDKTLAGVIAHAEQQRDQFEAERNRAQEMFADLLSALKAIELAVMSHSRGSKDPLPKDIAEAMPLVHRAIADAESR